MISFFPCAHASHPFWPLALDQVVVQLEVQIAMQQRTAPAQLGVVYVSARYAAYAGDMLTQLAQAFPGVPHWVGSTAPSVLAGDMDYGQVGALAVMLLYLGAQDCQLFSSLRPLPPAADHAPGLALVHGHVAAHQRATVLQALHAHRPQVMWMGGWGDAGTAHAHWAWSRAAQGLEHEQGAALLPQGCAGVVLGPQVDYLHARVQGCRPAGPTHTVTRAHHHVLYELDGQPALPVLQRALHASAQAEDLSTALLAQWPAGDDGSDTCLPVQARVMQVTGTDPVGGSVQLSDSLVPGAMLRGCAWDAHTMLTDVRRSCAEVWEALTTWELAGPENAKSGATGARSISGAIYIRSQYRHAMARMPQADAELQLIRQVLGPIPLLGWTTSCEIDAGQLQHLSAQLLVFTQPLQALR